MADRLGDAEIGVRIRDLGIGSALQGIRQNIRGGLGNILSVAGGNLLSGLIQESVAQVKNLVSAGMAANAQFDQMTTSMSVMLGSQRQATRLMGELRDLAAKSPFEMTGITQAATTLLATKQVGEDEVIPMLKKLGDAAAGSAIGFEALPRIMLAVSQSLSAGRISAQDMNQLAQAGIPAWSLLAKQLGVTQAEARKLSKEGKLGADAVRALIDGLGAGYTGLMEKQSRTFKGLLSTLKDQVTMSMAQITRPIYDEVTNLMKGLVDGLGGGGGMQSIVDKIAVGVKKLVDFIKTGLQNPLVQIAGKFLAVAAAVLAVGAAASFIPGLIATLAGLAPMLVVVTGITAAMTGLVTLIQQAFAGPEGPAFRKQLADIWFLVKEIALNIKEGIVAAFNRLSGAVGSTFDKAGGLQKQFNSVFGAVIEGVRKAADALSILTSDWERAWKFLSIGAQAGISLIGDLFGYLFQDLVPYLAAESGNQLMQLFFYAAKMIALNWVDVFVKMIDGISAMFKEFFDHQVSRFKSLVSALESIKKGNYTKALSDIVAAQYGLNQGQAEGAGEKAKQAIKDFAMDVVNPSFRFFTPSQKTKSLAAQASELWAELTRVRGEKRVGRFVDGLGLDRFTAAALGEGFGKLLGKGEAGGRGLFQDFLNSFRSKELAGKEDAKKSQRTEFVGLSDLNKRIQSALTSEDAKRHKEAIGVAKKGVAAAEKGAKAGEAVAAGVAALTGAVKAIPWGFGT